MCRGFIFTVLGFVSDVFFGFFFAGVLEKPKSVRVALDKTRVSAVRGRDDDGDDDDDELYE